MMTSIPLREPKAVSAPGKVLLAGGYLVLDRGYTGLVFGLDARIHVCVEPIQTNSGVILSEIIVKSPQFKDATWRYGYHLSEDEGGIEVMQLRPSHDCPINRNPFVETALAYALTYVSSHNPPHPIQSSSISILADNSYYSNPGTKTSTRFHDFGVPLSAAHKTGLGSSAALVTSFTAALLTFYLPTDIFDITSNASLTILHNLSQAAHCAAQGKVGSGFDVASAVYGSCLYRRFSPALLSAISSPGARGFATHLKTLVEGKAWDTEILKSAVQIPSNLRLVMCDVDCGSQTPGMVKQVLQWRASNKAEAGPLWDELQRRNEAFAAELTRLASSQLEDVDDQKKYTKLSDIILAIRALIRKMSSLSNVPIEPPQQTALLDAISRIPGVIGGVVPGAGGYDAVAVLVEDKEDVLMELQRLLRGWKVNEQADGQNEVKIGNVGMLGVREEMVGVRLEDTVLYKEWI